LDANFSTLSALADLEDAAATGRSLSRDEAARVAACADLPSVGALGEIARKAHHGERVTFVRVCEVPVEATVNDIGDAGEVRLTGAPASGDDAVAQVARVAELARGIPVTGFSLADVLRLAQGDMAVLASLCERLRKAGLESIDIAVDEIDDVPAAVAAIRAAAGAGLAVWRATVTRAPFAQRLRLIEIAGAVQRETGALRAFAPLPRVDPVDQPSTGYDDVRTVALARLVCGDVPSIQVDWVTYGPKLAQVAVAFGADDIDRIASVAAPELGRRRSPSEEIARHIRMAFATPVERDGRYGVRA
jgi:hypothetical protein